MNQRLSTKWSDAANLTMRLVAIAENDKGTMLAKVRRMGTVLLDGKKHETGDFAKLTLREMDAVSRLLQTEHLSRMYHYPIGATASN